MKRDHLVRLHDMLENIDAVAGMIAGRGFPFRAQDKSRRRTVNRNRIGSLTRVSDAEKETHLETPWPEIAALGNLMRHEYQRVDAYLIWKIATRSLPELRVVVKDLIARAERRETE